MGAHIYLQVAAQHREMVPTAFRNIENAVVATCAGPATGAVVPSTGGGWPSGGANAEPLPGRPATPK